MSFIRILWPFILEGGSLSVVVLISGFLVFNVYFLKVDSNRSETLTRQNSKNHHENLEDALVQPPFLPSSDPFWYELFQREWSLFSKTIMTKFIMNWYRLLSLDSDEDFTNAFLGDMKLIGDVLFEMLAHIRFSHGREWSLWLINEVVGRTVLDHFSNWKQENPSYDVFNEDVFSSTPHEQTTKYFPIERNELVTLLLDEFIQGFLKKFDEISTSFTLKSKNGSYEIFRENPLVRHFLLVILRDMILTKYIQGFHVGTYLENYLENRNPLVDLSSLDIGHHFDDEKTSIYSNANLCLPILKLIRQHTELAWQKTLCLLILGTMRIPILGRWLKIWANHHIHRLCLRLIHPWMFCKLIHYLNSQMIQDPSFVVNSSQKLPEYRGNLIEQNLAKLARSIILHEPIVTDAPYLLLKIIDDACSSSSF